MQEKSKKKRIAVTTSAEIANDIKNQSDDELKMYALSQKLVSTLAILEEKDREIEHLKQLLEAMTPTLTKASVLMPSDAEVITDAQLQRLKTAALERTLSLDEIRALDLLVKNNRIAKDAASEIIDHKGLPKNLPQDTLIKIASKKTNG